MASGPASWRSPSLEDGDRPTFPSLTAPPDPTGNPED
jgi:hypothetical protein